MKIILIQFKKLFLPVFLCLFTLCLIIFSSQNLIAAKNGLMIWANSIVPSLLPFFITTELLMHTPVVNYLGKLLDKFMKPIFNVSGIGAFPFIMGIISGYPTGAKIVSTFKDNNICSTAECERLLAFTNNSGPLFIIGTVGISIFGDTRIGLLLLLIHIISSVLVGIIFRFWKYNDKIYCKTSKNCTLNNSNLTISNLGEILGNSITKSINTVVTIGGFVVIFSVFLSILENSGVLTLLSNFLYKLLSIFGFDFNNIHALTSGLFEITNGLNKLGIISNSFASNSIIIASFLLGFGGLSVSLQVLSIISKSNLSIKPYLYGKFLHGIIASIITFIIINNFNFFSIDIPHTFSTNVNSLNINYINNHFYIICGTLILLMFILLRIKKKKYSS